jgi:hypothetical protein
MAARTKLSPASSNLQNLRTSATLISELQTISDPLKRTRCRSRAAELAQTGATQLLVVRAWDFDMNVDAVEHGAGDALLILGNDSRRTSTSFLWIICPPARAGMYAIEQLFLVLSMAIGSA